MTNRRCERMRELLSARLDDRTPARPSAPTSEADFLAADGDLLGRFEGEGESECGTAAPSTSSGQALGCVPPFGGAGVSPANEAQPPRLRPSVVAQAPPPVNRAQHAVPLRTSPKAGKLLSARERTTAAAHLAECASCRAWLAQVQAAQARLRAHPTIEPAPGFDAAVMARVTASPLIHAMDAVDRLFCTPARQIAAATAAALVLSAVMLTAAARIMPVAAASRLPTIEEAPLRPARIDPAAEKRLAQALARAIPGIDPRELGLVPPSETSEETPSAHRW